MESRGFTPELIPTPSDASPIPYWISCQRAAGILLCQMRYPATLLIGLVGAIPLSQICVFFRYR